MQKISHVLFDLDNTLIDESIYKKIFPKLKKEIKKRLHIDEKRLRELLKKQKIPFGKRFDTGTFCRKNGLLRIYYPVLRSELKKNDYLGKDVKKIFSFLKKKKIKIGIVSNSMKKTIELFTIAYKIKPGFIFSSTDAGCEKKHRRYWEMLVKSKYLKPQECIMIGNSMQDIRIPRELGFNTIKIKNTKELSAIGSILTKTI